jgi:hypothetical protein
MLSLSPPMRTTRKFTGFLSGLFSGLSITMPMNGVMPVGSRPARTVSTSAVEEVPDEIARLKVPQQRFADCVEEQLAMEPAPEVPKGPPE